MYRQQVVEPEQMPKACVGCGKKAGLQKSVEIHKLSQYIGVQVDKSDSKQSINFTPQLNLEKFIRAQKLMGQAP